MADVERIRKKALEKLQTRGGLDAAIKVVDGAFKKADATSAPIVLLTTKLEVYLEAGESKAALDWLKEGLKARKTAADRGALLDTAEPLATAESGAANLFFLWSQWARLFNPERCHVISRHFAELPATELDQFATNCRSWRDDQKTRPIGDLGLAHVNLARGAPGKAAPFLRDLARTRREFAVHAADLITESPPGPEPVSRWIEVEIHLNAGRRPAALELFSGLLADSPADGARLLVEALESSVISPEEAESLSVGALTEAPNCRPIRYFLARKCAAEERPHEAAGHLIAVARSGADGENLEKCLASLDALLEAVPNDPTLGLGRAEVLALLRREEDLDSALAELLTIAPTEVLRVLDL